MQQCKGPVGEFGPHPTSHVPLAVKNLPANAEDTRRSFDPWVEKIPWRRAWKSTPVFLPGESQGQRSLVGCCLWGLTESDVTEQQQQQLKRGSEDALPSTVGSKVKVSLKRGLGA